MKYHAQVEDQKYIIDIDDENSIVVDDQPVRTNLLQVGPLGLYSLLMDNESYELVVEEQRFGYRVTLGSNTYDVQVTDERTLRLNAGRSQLTTPSGERFIKAPIPGMIVKIMVQEGAEITANQPVIILEAMKMENELRAQRDGVVKEILINAGESVEQGAELILIA
jgi:biotin carboxyl carrier protein